MMTETKNNQVGATNGVTTTTTTTTGGTQIMFNGNYFRTQVGLLKIVEWVIAIICIALASPAYFAAVDYFLFVVVTCFIITFIWACLHLFTVTQVLNLHWVKIELGYTAVATVLYAIAVIVILVCTSTSKDGTRLYHWNHSRYGAYIAAGVFAILNTGAYGYETFLHYMKFKSSG